MKKFEDYKSTAIELKEKLDTVSNIEDVINLRKVGISEKDINSIDVGIGFDEAIVQQLHKLDGNTEVLGIHLNTYVSDNGAAIEDPLYTNTQDGVLCTMTFDIYDDEGEPVLSDVSIDTMEEFRSYLETQIENDNELYPTPDAPTIFCKVKLLNGFQAELSEVTEHLAMNGYTYDTNGEDSIFIYEEELSYLETILQDRNLKYEIQ